MKTLLTVLVMSLVVVSPAIAEAPEGWKMCLEWSQNFSRLPEVDAELGPMLTLPARVSQYAKTLLERIRQISLGKPIWQELSVEERRQLKFVEHGRLLTDNCGIWLMLGETAEIATAVTALREPWQTYLEQRQVRLTSLRRFGAPEQLAQEATALRQKSEQFDLSRSYWRQMSPEERQLFEDLKQELPLVVEFKSWLDKRD